MIAAQDLDRAIGQPFQDCLAVNGRPQRRIHLKGCIVSRPFGKLFQQVKANNFFPVCAPEFLAAGDRGVREREMMRACLARDGHASLLCFAQEPHAAGGA